jgi:hypothetical protein
MNFFTVSGVAETRLSPAARSRRTAILIVAATRFYWITRMMSRTSTQIIGVDHFTRFTKPSYVALAAFMSFAEAMFHPQKLRARQALPDCSSVHTL